MINLLFIIGIALLLPFAILPFMINLIKFFFSKEIIISKRFKWYSVAFFAIVLLFIDLDYKSTFKDLISYKFHFSKKAPNIKFDLRQRDVSLYAQGDTINGIIWDESYEKYELIIENKSDYTIHDFRCFIDIPGFIIRKDLISSETDNKMFVDLRYYDYEQEIFEKQDNGDFVVVECVVNNRVDLFVNKFEKQHRIGIWFYVKRIILDGKMIVEFYDNNDKDNKVTEAYMIWGKTRAKPMIISDSLISDYQISFKQMNLQPVTLDNKDNSRTISKPKY